MPGNGDHEGQNPVISADGGYRIGNRDGWTYLHIEGDAGRRGHQHGTLLHAEIGRIIAHMKYLTLQNTGKEWFYFVAAAVELWSSRVSSEIIEEIKGIAAGASEAGTPVSWQDVLCWNGYMELTGYWYPTVAARDRYAPVPGAASRCSAFIARGGRTATGRIVVAHNSWDNFETGQFWNLIIDLKPSTGHRVLFQSAPGLVQSNTDFFVTSAGLIGTETTMGGFNVYNDKGMPEFARIRQAMQYGDTLDDYVRILTTDNSGGYANSWLFGNIRSNDIMRLELGLRYWNVEVNPACDYFIGFNAALDPRIRNLECSNTGFADIRRHQGARQVRLAQLMDEHSGLITTDVARTILADHYDVYLNRADNPCSRTVDGHYWLDAREFMSQADRPLPFQPRGTFDGKTCDSAMAEKMTFDARWGNSSGLPFDADAFLARHRQWEYLRGYLDSRPSRPWTRFGIDERADAAR
jgi:hypothetical protein